MTIWGTDASGGAYAAIAALTNIPATICGALFYEFICLDSSRGTLPIGCCLRYSFIDLQSFQ